MIRYSWAHLDERLREVAGDSRAEWGVRAQGNAGQTTSLAGNEVPVEKRDHTVKRVVLGKRLDSYNAGRTSIYAVERRAR